MRIGINGQRLLVKDPAGPEKYTYNLINALARIDHDNEYRIYFEGAPDKEYFSRLVYSNSSFKAVPLKGDISWTQIGLAKELMKNPVDLLFTPMHTMPIFRKSSLQVVGMIHGLEYKYSKRTKNVLKRLLLGKPEMYLAKHSTALIVPTQATKNEILRRGWVQDSENKITVIHEGVGDCFYKRDVQEISAIRKKYNLQDYHYLLFVSTIQPRKNIPSMVAAYAEAIHLDPSLSDTKLLIVGKTGWDTEESFNAPRKHGVEKNVLFLGFLPDEDLPALFSGATAFISLSLEEGFGLPLLEAMACETPALVSSIPAFKEVGGEFPIYVNPTDVRGFAKTIIKTFTSKYETERIYGAKLRAREFTWDRTAQKTLEVFQKVVENG